MKSVIFALLFSISAMAQTGSPTRPANQQDPQKKEEAEKSSKVPVPTGKYITGGILASTLGFGIGHGVQGRYGEKGWIFTAADAAGLAMVISGCSDAKDTDLDGDDDECNNNGLVSAGLGVLIGFRVWEVLDAWLGATPVDTEASAMVVPDSDGAKLVVGWRF